MIRQTRPKDNSQRNFSAAWGRHHALREKRPKKKTVILQQDNAGPHTARLALQTIQKNGWELLSNPPYCPDLDPSDYHLFGPLKYHLRGHHYETDEAVQEAVRSWLRGAGTDFYSRGIFKILQRQKCIDLDGDFVRM
jgi:transposase